MLDQKQRRLSGFDMFGIVSGIIGLLAAGIALSIIFVHLQGVQAVPHPEVVV